MFAVAVGRIWTQRSGVDPGDQGHIGGQRGLDFVQPGDLARQWAVILNELDLELTQGDARQLALALQVFGSLRPPGLVEALGRGFHQLVEPFQIGGQFAESDSLCGSETPILARGQLVEQAAARSSSPRCQASAG